MTSRPRPLGLWSEDPELLAAELFRWSERLVGSDGAVIHILTDRGLEARWMTETRLRAGEVISVEAGNREPIARAARYGVTQIVTEESELSSEPIHSFGWKAAVSIPLLVDERVVGVFSAGWRMPAPVTSDARLVLEAAASLTASALHRVGLMEDVKREQDRLQQVLEWLPVVASIIDTETLTIRWTNHEARRLFGDLTGNNAHGALLREALEVYHDETVPTRDGVKAALQMDLPLGRIRVRTVQGTWRVLESTVAPLGNDLALLIQMDVTRDANIEEERDRFVHMLSHHLRTPLTPILGFVDLMIDPDLDRTIRTEAVSSIRSSMKRIEHVVSRLEQIASLRPVDQAMMTTYPAADLIHEAARRVEGLHEEMEVQGAPDARAHCAGPHVVQALEELLSNAVVHGAPPVTVTVRKGRYTEIDVTDAGAGIPPAWEQAVFSPFLNPAEGYLAPSPDSLGLGLNLARALILATGGHLSYSGRSFTIRLRREATSRLDSMLSPSDSGGT